MKKNIVWTDIAKAKWLKKKLEQIKVITDNFGQHTLAYIEAITKFKSQTGISFENADTEIKRLFKSYFAEKHNKEKAKLEEHKPTLF
jgi:hypothetical protein